MHDNEREPFLNKGDRVFHRGTDKTGVVIVVARGLDVDRVSIKCDDDTIIDNTPAKMCKKL